jgi:hypothetical protein
MSYAENEIQEELDEALGKAVRTFARCGLGLPILARKLIGNCAISEKSDNIWCARDPRFRTYR